jgi:GPH family glycoside/pentoside/hexuronide:cation symporter
MSGARLSRLNRVGFGVGDFGLNLFWNMTNLFVLYYYTDILGLPNAVAGNIVMVAMIWDGITDPLIGYFASRANSRYGKYRPFILVGALPLCISFACMFYRPDLPEVWLIVYVAASHVLFRTFYTVVSIPYGSLTARITRDADERGSLSVYRLLFAASAGVLVAGFTLALAKGFGGGDMGQGFFYAAALYAALAAIAILACFFFTDEKAVDGVSDGDIPSLADVGRMLRGNTAFWLVFLIVVFGNTGATISGKSLIYYLKYNLNAEEAIGTATGLSALVIVLALPVWGYLSRRTDKRTVWLTGSCISIATALCLYFNPFQETAVVIPLMVMGSIGAAAGYFSVWATLPDTVEYGEWKTGVRAESVLFGLVSFAQKVSLGLAVGALGLLLDAFGYRANEEQTADALRGLHLLVSLIPMSCAVVCVVLISRYRLGREFHARITAEISRRHSSTPFQEAKEP